MVAFYFAIGLLLFAQEPALGAKEIVPQAPFTQDFVERFDELFML